MQYTKTFIITSAIVTDFLLSACRTADGEYTKNHTLFNNNESYKVGWEDGRLQCKGK